MEKKNDKCKQKLIDVGIHYNINGRFIPPRRTNRLKENEVDNVLNDTSKKPILGTPIYILFYIIL